VDRGLEASVMRYEKTLLFVISDNGANDTSLSSTGALATGTTTPLSRPFPTAAASPPAAAAILPTTVATIAAPPFLSS